MSDPYLDFLAAKVRIAAQSGFDIAPEHVHPLLKPHQRDTVRWACLGGRRALFKAFGLGKTFDQLEILRLCRVHAGGAVLIVVPLGVRYLEAAEREMSMPSLFDAIEPDKAA